MDGWDGIGIKWMVIVGSLRARSVLVKLKLGFSPGKSLCTYQLYPVPAKLLFLFSLNRSIDNHGQEMGIYQ